MAGILRGPGRGLPLLLLLMAPGLVQAEGEEPGARSLGLTMLGAIFMIMGLILCTHMRDHDIRKVTWTTINNTISIFCAVIMFKNVSQLAGKIFSSSESSPEKQILMNRFYVMFWYLCLFLAIYVWCGGLRKGLEWRKAVYSKKGAQAAVEEEDESGTPRSWLVPMNWCDGALPSLSASQNRMKACLFLAHTTGFAGLEGWGMKMNTDEYRGSAWQCALLIPQAAIWYTVIIWLLSFGRRLIFDPSYLPFKCCCSCVQLEESEGKKRPDRLLLLAEEHLEDGENDFFGLFMGFLVVSTLRFAVGGHLPDEEGEEGENVFKHSLLEAGLMYLVSAILFCVAYFSLWFKDKVVARWVEHTKGNEPRSQTASEEKKKEESKEVKEEKAEESEEEEDDDETKFFRDWAGRTFVPCFHFCCVSSHCISAEEWPKWNEFLVEEIAGTSARLFEMWVNTMSFSFAWCFMYATQWLLARFFEGQEMELGIVLAIVTTLWSCVFVYILDKLADESENRSADAKKKKLERMKHHWSNSNHGHWAAKKHTEEVEIEEDEDVVHRKLMASTGILIGFVWEQCFDTAVAGVAGSSIPCLKPLLAILTVVVIWPVWLWYLVPMEINGGYILGFVSRGIKWKLHNLALDQEPQVRRKVKESVEALLLVMTKNNPKLMSRILDDALGGLDPKGCLKDGDHDGALGDEAKKEKGDELAFLDKLLLDRAAKYRNPQLLEKMLGGLENKDLVERVVSEYTKLPKADDGRFHPPELPAKKGS